MKRILILMAAAATMVACNSKTTNSGEQTQQGVLTKSAAVEQGVVKLTEVFTSEIQPNKMNNITPAAQGVHIDKILVDVGDRVQEGELLITLDPTQYSQQLVQLATVEDDYNRLQPVYEAGGISAQQMVQAKARLDIQREVVENLKKNIEYRSPITGVITARNAEAGDLLTGAPILQVMQIEPLKVIVNLSEQYFPYVKVGMPVDLTVDIYPEEHFVGKVSLIYPALDAATRTFKVEVKVQNRKELLRPGMFARTTFEMGQKQGLLVPDVAVQKQIGTAERYLYVIKDGKAERRRVEMGRQIGDRIDILSGVAAGEEVAITALAKLYNGAPVVVKNE